VRFKWLQNGLGGAFYIKIWEDDSGIPGSEIYSATQASGSSDGWNGKDLSAEGLSVSGDFWVGAKEFTSSQPFGLDTDNSSGNSYKRIGSDGDWTQVEGNLMYRVYIDSLGGAGRVISNSGNTEEAVRKKYPIYTLKWENKRLRRVPLQMNGNQVFRSESPPLFLNRSNVLTDEIIPLMIFDFEDELTELWTYDAGWNLTTSDYYSPSHSLNSPNSPNSNLLSVESKIIPNKYNIFEIYPNPFNPATNIQFEVAEFSQVKLSIIDLNGRLVSVLGNGKMNSGQYQTLWDGIDIYGNQVSSGIYLAVLESNGMLVQTQKLVLLK